MTYSRLSVGTYGSDMNQLHALLRNQGFQIPESEVKQGFFGPETRRAVISFQNATGVEKTGYVDEKMIAALGAAPATSPAPAAVAPAPPSTANKQVLMTAAPLTGLASSIESTFEHAVKKIAAPIKSGDRGDAVGNLQDALLLLMRKNIFQPTEDQRGFLDDELPKERNEQVYKRVTTKAVAIFQDQHQLRVEHQGEVDALTADVLNRELDELGAFEQSRAEWRVRGRVADTNGPLNDILVNVFDRDLFSGRDTTSTGKLLGVGSTKRSLATNEDGWFEIAYATAQFAPGDVAKDGIVTPDLIFALSRDGQPLEKFQIYRLPDAKELAEETLVSDDDLILGIQSRRLEEVRILIPGGELKPQMSEYERLWRAIEPLLPEQAPDNADAAQRERLVCAAATRFDEERHRDLSFVARETALDRMLIQKFANACRLAVDPFHNVLGASVFYALARIRVAADLSALARLSTDDLRLALQQATMDAPPLIPPFNPADRLEETVRTIRDVLASHLPNYRSAEGTPSLADLMGTDLPNADEQATLWRIYSDHVGTAAEFWQKLEGQPGFEDPNKIAKVQYKFQLGLLTQNNIALVNAVRSRHPEVTDTGELAFHLDTPDKWAALLNDPAVSIPPDVPGDAQERKANYGASLAGAMQVAHPTAAVANMVASLAPTELANTQPAVSKFLTDAVRKVQFDLVAGRIDDLVAQHGANLLENVDLKDRPIVIDQVKRLQRLFRLSSGPDSMKALIDAGFNSARELAELPPELAMEMLGPVLGETTARLMLNRASKISSAAVHQYVYLRGLVNDDSPSGGFL